MVNDRSRDIGPFIEADDDNMIICRCEEVTKGEIRRAVHDGMYTLADIRRSLRTGMGLCQGQTCSKLVRGIVARELKISPLELEAVIARAPMRPIEMKVLSRDTGGEADEYFAKSVFGGSGILGFAEANNLAKKGVSVFVLDCSEGFGGRWSSRNWGG